jgi:hypothetical protein
MNYSPNEMDEEKKRWRAWGNSNLLMARTA